MSRIANAIFLSWADSYEDEGLRDWYADGLDFIYDLNSATEGEVAQGVGQATRGNPMVREVRDHRSEVGLLAR